jgi:hypothetical protein
VTAVPGGVARAQAALAFIRATRERSELRQQLAELDPVDGLGPVVSRAVAAGFNIEAESLRVAYAYDWSCAVPATGRQPMPRKVPPARWRS